MRTPNECWCGTPVSFHRSAFAPFAHRDEATVHEPCCYQHAQDWLCAHFSSHALMTTRLPSKLRHQNKDTKW